MFSAVAGVPVIDGVPTALSVVVSFLLLGLPSVLLSSDVPVLCCAAVDPSVPTLVDVPGVTAG